MEKIITFDEMWHFIETTTVNERVLEIISPETGTKVPSQEYIFYNCWEMRFNLPKLKELWESSHTFIIHGSTITPTVREIIEEVERDNNAECQSHIYAGKTGSRSFPIHCDNPDNIIIQCIGKSRITVYNEYGHERGNLEDDTGLTIKEQTILEPGNYIYIPAKQYHLFEPLVDRLSISIPIIKK